MKSFKERRHEKLNEKALDQAIKKVIGPIGDYNYNIGRIDFFLSEKILKQYNLYDLVLPSWEAVLSEAKKIYNKFDDKGIKKIIYRLENMNISQKICLTTKNSDIQIDCCFFNGLEIFDALRVECNYKILNQEELYPINIKAKDIEFFKMFEDDNISRMNLNADYINFDKSDLYCANSNVSMNANFIWLEKSNICKAINIKLNAKCIDLDNSILEANNIIMNNEECGEIKGLDAKKIIYNGEDITNSIQIPKVRKELINKLEEIRKNIIKEINKDIKQYKEELNNTSISKVLKK